MDDYLKGIVEATGDYAPHGRRTNMELGKCIETGSHDEYVHHILLDEYPNDVLKISTVFAKGENGYSENSILLARATVKVLIRALQAWLKED